MIKKIDLYLLKYFFLSLVVVILCLGLTIIVINMVEQLRDFLDHNVPILKIIEYYTYFGGWIIKAFMPMFVMLAILFTVTILSRRLELLAMKAAGRSLYRISMPLLVAALLLSAGHFYYNEYIFPPANKKRIEIKEFTIENRSKKTFVNVRKIYRQISPGKFYTIAKLDTETGSGSDLKLYRTTNNRLDELLIAEKVTYTNFRWVARIGMIRYFDEQAVETFRMFDSLVIEDIKEKPSDLAKRIGKPEDMGIDALRNYIDLMKRTGGPYLRESIDLQLKYAFPLTTFVVTLMCIPFASDPRRGSMAVAFAAGAGLALVYFVAFRVMQSAGYNEKIPAMVAVWGINGLFLLIGVILMVRARK